MKYHVRRVGSRPVMATFVIALFVRLAFVIAQIELQLFDIAFDATDSSLYRSLAGSLAAGKGFVGADGQPTAFVGIGYPLFLAMLFQVSDSTLFIALVQSWIGSTTVALIAQTGGALGRTKGAWIAGLAAAVYPHLVFWTGYVLTETLYVFLLVAAIASAIAVLRQGDPTTRFGTLSGAVFGAAALVRPIALGLGILLVAMGLALRSYRKPALFGLAALTLVMAPWVVRNVTVLGSPVITSTESGYVLWQGNSPDATGGTRGYVDHLDFTPLHLPEEMTEVERDAEYRRGALEWMSDNPEDVAALAPKKLWNMWRPVYEGASLFNILVTSMTYIPLVVLSILGLYRVRRHPIGILLITAVSYHLVVHGLVTGMIRFRLPVEALLLIAVAGLAVPAAGVITRLPRRTA